MTKKYIYIIWKGRWKMRRHEKENMEVKVEDEKCFFTRD